MSKEYVTGDGTEDGLEPEPPRLRDVLPFIVLMATIGYATTVFISLW